MKEFRTVNTTMRAFKSFIERSPSAKDPSPRIERYGFRKSRILEILESDDDNFCVIDTIHHDLGEIFALMWFTVVLRKQDYRKAMARKYELENLIEERFHNLVNGKKDVHVFLFHEILHPNFTRGKTRTEMEARNDVHLVKYQDGDGMYLNRRVIIDENLSNLTKLVANLGVIAYDINERHKGATDESILKMGLRREFNDVLITRDKEFAQITRSMGYEVIELTSEDQIANSLEMQEKLITKIRDELEKLNFTIVPLTTLSMTDKELLEFIAPVIDQLTLLLDNFLKTGILHHDISKKDLQLPLAETILQHLEKEGMLQVSFKDREQHDNEEISSSTLTIQLQPSHPTWKRLLQFQEIHVLNYISIPSHLMTLLHFMITKENQLDLRYLLDMGLIYWNDGILKITELGTAYLDLIFSHPSAKDLELSSSINLTATSSNSLPEITARPSKNKTTTKDRKIITPSEKDRRAFLELFLQVCNQKKRRYAYLKEVEQAWKKRNRSPQKFETAWKSLVKDGLISKKDATLTLKKKAYRFKQYLDLIMLHEIIMHENFHHTKNIYYSELKKKMIDNGSNPHDIDEIYEILKRQRKIIDESGFLSPHSLLKGKEAAHFKAFSYVISAPTQQRTFEQVITYLQERLQLKENEARNVVEMLITEDVLFTFTKHEGNEKIAMVGMGPNGKEFARLLSSKNSTTN